MSYSRQDEIADNDGRVWPPCDSEPHGEDTATSRMREVALARAARLADENLKPGRFWPASLDKIDAVAAGVVLREFCEAFGIPVPADAKRAQRAFAALVKALRQ